MALKKAKVIKKENLTDDVIEITFEALEEFSFESGQFINIKVNDDGNMPCFRAYSIATSPQKNSDQFGLCIKVVEDGRGSNWLNSLKENDEIEFIGPIGYFTFKKKPEMKTFFIATGTGVAPFRSMIEDQLGKGVSAEFELLFGVRHESDLFYQELFKGLEEKHSNFNFKMTLSRPETEQWTGIQGRVTNYLEEAQIDPQKTEVYICGLKAMIDEVIKIFTEKGIPEECIHFEKYD